jgi:thioredoxin
MAFDATEDNYASLVGEGPVLVDFWGPRCVPCLALMPHVEKLEESFPKLRVVKVNAADNRQICRDLGVFGLPTYLLYKDGVEVDRITGQPTIAEIKAGVERLLNGGG